MHNTTKHTPGPWVVRNRDAVYAQSGRFVADCELTPYGSRPQPPNSIDEANAHLIAAAPAMYALIKDMRQAFYVDGKRKALLAVMERSHDVVAQAEGRQPQP